MPPETEAHLHLESANVCALGVSVTALPEQCFFKGILTFVSDFFKAMVIRNNNWS